MALRVLHTADWHLGQTLRGHSRDYEHAQVLAHIVALTSQLQPDAFLLAGDVYDSPNPPAEAQRLFYKTLVQLHNACPAMTIVVTAGNHDAATRLEAPRDLFAAVRVHVTGNVRRTGNQPVPENHLVPIRSATDELLGHILAVSYPTSACLPAVAPAPGQSQLVTAVGKLYADLVDATRPQWEGLPLILTGHLHVSGAEESEGSERPILIGGENAIPAANFPPEAAYIALGHLHKAQRVGADHIRYSGSLIPMSASEIGYRHAVTFIEAGGPNGLQIQQHPLPRPVPFHRLPAQGYTAQRDVPALLKSIAAENKPYIYLRLQREGLTPDFREALDNEAEKRGLRLIEIRLEELEHGGPKDAPPPLTLAEQDPQAIFNRAFSETHGKPPEPAHSAIFLHALEEARHA